jgi:hypothetical protein
MTNMVTCCALLRYSAYFPYMLLQIEPVIYRRNHLFLMSPSRSGIETSRKRRSFNDIHFAVFPFAAQYQTLETLASHEKQVRDAFRVVRQLNGTVSVVGSVFARYERDLRDLVK